MTVVAEAANGSEAVTHAVEHQPDVVPMDVRMPHTDGLTAIERLSAMGSCPRVVMLTTFDLDEYVYRALRAGAAGFLLKDTMPDRLLDGVRVAAEGEALLAPSVTRRLIDEYRSSSFSS